MSGVGAGLDSFYEYLLKSHILFGRDLDLQRFVALFEATRDRMKFGRKFCGDLEGFPPVFSNVDMHTGEVMNNWIDSLQVGGMFFSERFITCFLDVFFICFFYVVFSESKVDILSSDF